MRLLIICQYFYPEQFRVNDICFELAKEGHTVTVLTGLPNYPSGIVDKKYKWFKNRKEEINGVRVIRSWLLGRGFGIKRLALNYVTFAISSTINTLFLKKDFDIILVYQLSPITMALPGVFLKKITRKPLVIYCHDLWPESLVSAGFSTKSSIYTVLLKLSKWIYKSADAIFTSSKLFEKYFIRILEVRNPIIYLPVYAEDLFEKVDNTILNDNDINLVFAGNIGEMQSVETIIYAAKELQPYTYIKWHIVGDGSARKKCEELAKQLNLINVIFYGHHPLSDMPTFYQMADAFLITLKANKVISYTLPNKVQSYMAAGKPILGAIDGETQEVIREAECGLCCQAEDYKSFARNIITFAQNKESHEIYGNNARQYYERNFSKTIYMKRLNALLLEIS